VMMLDVPAVQLKHQSAARNEPFILRPAMPALAAKEPLIPAAAGSTSRTQIRGCGCIRHVVNWSTRTRRC
jgi:hypothetical protein